MFVFVFALDLFSFTSSHHVRALFTLYLENSLWGCKNAKVVDFFSIRCSLPLMFRYVRKLKIPFCSFFLHFIFHFFLCFNIFSFLNVFFCSLALLFAGFRGFLQCSLVHLFFRSFNFWNAFLNITNCDTPGFQPVCVCVCAIHWKCSEGLACMMKFPFFHMSLQHCISHSGGGGDRMDLCSSSLSGVPKTLANKIRVSIFIENSQWNRMKRRMNAKHKNYTQKQTNVYVKATTETATKKNSSNRKW